MSDNLALFLDELDAATKDMTEGQLVLVHRRLHLDALARVVEKTPVDTGRTRGNWQSTLTSPASGQIEERSAAAVIAEGETAVRNVEPFGVSYIANNVDHILVLENGGFVPPNPGPSKDPRGRGRPGDPSGDRYGRVLVKGGFSIQAAHGMVAITVEELRPQRLES